MQGSSPIEANGQAPGFAEYLAILKKRRRLLLNIVVPIAALGALLAITLPDVYRSVALIEIDEQQTMQNMLARGPSNDQEQEYADQYVQSLSTRVLSDANLRRLLQQHTLYDTGESERELVSRLRRDIDVSIVTARILDPRTGREREVVSAFNIGYDNRDPRRAYEGASWLVNAFLEENRRDRQRVAASAAKFFAAEADRLGKHVAALENRLAEFKAKNQGSLPDLTGVNLNVMARTEEDIQNIEMQMQALRRERVFLMAQLQQASAAAPETATLRQLEEEYRRKSVSYDESHPDMISLRRQIEQLRTGGSVAGMTLQQQLQNQRAILSEARQRYSDDHPDVKRILRNIEALEARIASGETADRTLSSDSPMAVQLRTQLNATDSQLAALQARSAELRAKLTELENRLSAAPEVEREFQEVTRDLAGARAKYDELLKRQMDAEVSEAAIAGGTVDKFRVAQEPVVPRTPAKPARLAIFLVSLVLAVALGFAAVVAAQFLDQTVRGVRDIRDILNVTPLAAVPEIQTAGTLSLRRRQAVIFVARTAVGLAIVYYVTSQFLF
ncbi:MAG: hypothetical protein GX535_12625 [Xanthomonadaceae bacterium]|nr:hypothetical protein [Xanthomonadaceae bacterium]